MNNTKRIIDVVCLVLWITQLVFAIIATCGAATVTPVMYSCSVIICIFHYICELHNA